MTRRRVPWCWTSWFPLPATAEFHDSVLELGERGPVPEYFARAHLAWWQDQLLLGRERKWPGDRQFAEWWSWGRQRVRGLVEDLEAWSPPKKADQWRAWYSASVERNPTGSQVEPTQHRPNAHNGDRATQQDPNWIHTRVGDQTSDLRPLTPPNPPPQGGGPPDLVVHLAGYLATHTELRPMAAARSDLVARLAGAWLSQRGLLPAQTSQAAIADALQAAAVLGDVAAPELDEARIADLVRLVHDCDDDPAVAGVLATWARSADPHEREAARRLRPQVPTAELGELDERTGRPREVAPTAVPPTRLSPPPERSRPPVELGGGLGAVPTSSASSTTTRRPTPPTRAQGRTDPSTSADTSPRGSGDRSRARRERSDRRAQWVADRVFDELGQVDAGAALDALEAYAAPTAALVDRWVDYVRRRLAGLDGSRSRPVGVPEGVRRRDVEAGMAEAVARWRAGVRPGGSAPATAASSATVERPTTAASSATLERPTTTPELAKAWTVARALLEGRLGRQDVELWLRDAVLTARDAVWLPNAHFVSWVADEYAADLLAALGARTVRLHSAGGDRVLSDVDLEVASSAHDPGNVSSADGSVATRPHEPTADETPPSERCMMHSVSVAGPGAVRGSADVDELDQADPPAILAAAASELGLNPVDVPGGVLLEFVDDLEGASNALCRMLALEAASMVDRIRHDDGTGPPPALAWARRSLDLTHLFGGDAALAVTLHAWSDPNAPRTLREASRHWIADHPAGLPRLSSARLAALVDLAREARRVSPPIGGRSEHELRRGVFLEWTGSAWWATEEAAIAWLTLHGLEADA